MSENKFKDKFTDRFNEALKIFGLEKHKQINEEYTPKDHPVRGVVDIITGNIGREWGLATRLHTLEKAGLTEASLEEQMTELKKRFKEHMELHDIPIEYATIKDGRVLIIGVGGCIFKNNDLIPHEGYSIGFVQSYFGAKSINKSYTICEKALEECEGEKCEIWIEY